MKTIKKSTTLFFLFLFSFGFFGFNKTGLAQLDTNDFVTTYQAGIQNLGSAADSMVFIPTNSVHIYNYNVDWDNDGIFDTLGVSGPINHKYDSQGLKTVRISGQYPALAFNTLFKGGGLVSVDQWGNQVWKSMQNGFENCIHLQDVGLDAPILDSIESLESLFDGAFLFNTDISHWDVSNVRNMGALFYKAKSFNQNLGDWDISSVQATAVPLINGMWAILDSTNLSVANYDSTIIGWNNNPHYQNIGIGIAGLRYCLSKDDRDSLMADGWIFYGDALDCSGISITENETSVNILSVYPNPNTGAFTIHYANHNFSGTLEIYTLCGKKVHTHKIKNEGQLELNLQLAKGVYLLRLSSNKQNPNLSQRLIIQ